MLTSINVYHQQRLNNSNLISVFDFLCDLTGIRRTPVRPQTPTRPNRPNTPNNPLPPWWPQQPEQPPQRPEQPPQRPPWNPEFPPWNPEMPPHQPPMGPDQPPQGPGQPPVGPGSCGANFQAAMNFDSRLYLFQVKKKSNNGLCIKKGSKPKAVLYSPLIIQFASSHSYLECQNQ